MKSLTKIACVLSLAAILGLPAVTATARPLGSTAYSGMSNLPLRNCEGFWCGQLNRIAMDEQLKVLIYGSGGGWSYVEVVSTGQRGWVCNENVY
ncbi:hypothetical protein [Desulfolutivibrio sp.]|uniref:hypothetical protein n=1 Tax=Desulfolutivibrio sp. TaxID=2773296 RepID=UPI002F965787